MVGALWTGISGLSGSQTGLDNESNNIANVNTIGYKASRVSFADQMYQDKIGKGVTSFDVEKMYTQGNLKITGVSYDMGLSGDGFFQLSNGNETYYSRAGNFRMGESGELEDVGQNKVQGWAMSAITEDDIISTDTNATFFTNDFSKVLGNKIIRDSTTIETVVAKATDYNVTATSDVQSVFTGSGYKSASTKKADIETLVTEYNKLLTTHSNADPKPTASTSSVQKNYMNFNLDSVALAEGDEIYMYIDGKKYTQSFDTDELTTIKKFADVLSDTVGFKAHYTNGIEDNATGTVKESAYEYDNATSNPQGGVYLEGLVPGMQFRVTEFGWTDASNSNQATKGEVKTIQDAVQGTGLGAIESVEMALAQAVSGKQQDVYSTTELMLSTTNTDNDFTYQINIYDKDTKTNVTIPSVALDMSDMTDVDSMVTAINTVADTATGSAVNTELAYYVKAFNINGNLVVKTLDSNNDVEFTGELKGPIPEQQTVKITGKVDTVEHQTIDFTTGAAAAANDIEFLTHTVSGTLAGDTTEEVIDKIILDKANIMSTWNLANGGQEVADIIKIDADTVELVFKDGEGDVALILAAANASGDGNITYTDSVETQPGGGTFSFLGQAVANSSHGDSTSSTVEKIVADKTNIMATWNGANATREITDIIRVSGDEIKLVYKNTMGDVSNVTGAQGYSNNSYGVTFDTSEEIVKGELKGLIGKNINFSGREGAAAEFLKITTTINQTSSKDNLQLRLDSLGLTDSAFGDFSVDDSGLITMQQDGVDYAVGQVAIAKFTDNRGLEAVGGNLMKATTRSGTALFNIDNDKTAMVKGGQLELSTADLSESLVNLMVFQRAFEANAKSITTADQILTTLIQLKR